MEFSIACSELYFLISNLKKSELDKIPAEFLELICMLKIDDYVSKIDINKPLEEQELSIETKALICLLNKQLYYLLSFSFLSRDQGSEKRLYKRIQNVYVTSFI